MRDRDDIDMETWVRRAFEEEPAPGSFGDTVRDDLTRAHAGLTRRRRWAAAGTSGVAVAALAFAIAITPGVRTAGTDSAPASGGPSQDNRSDAPSLSAADQQLLDECERLNHKGEETAVSRTDLSGWTVVDRVDDGWGTTAILLDSDEDRWAECTVGVQAGFYAQDVRTPQRVPLGYVEQPDGTYKLKGSDYVSWAQRCVQVDGPDRDCTRDLYFLTTQLPVGVDSISVETYDGTVSQAQVTDGFVLWRAFGPVLNDYDGPLEGESTKPPIVLTYRGGGDVLSSYDANFLPPIPDGLCDGSGGC